MSINTGTASRVVPAQLSFLAIYNPSLGNTDDTFRNQVVFYYSKAAKPRSKNDAKNGELERALREEENEKLRQIGLAQGMVDFARSFSNGEAVDSVETHKSRIVLHELEAGWWILASIDLTQLPAPIMSANKATTDSSDTSPPDIEYSSREVTPPALLLQQLKHAHALFLLHHGYPLSHLLARLKRARFCYILERFWARFANNWDVMLHGSPAVDIFGGLKLAAGGELGIGVGEEEWGSGEREVLEDLARRTDGLVDIVVSRFGEPSLVQQQGHQKSKAANVKKHVAATAETEPWLGGGKYVGAEDGVVFSGVGALSRESLKDVSHWMESIYCYGEYAYGIKENPTSDRRKRRRRNPRETSTDLSSAPEIKRQHSTAGAQKMTLKSTAGEQNNAADATLPPGIPPPIVSAVESSLDKASSAVDSAIQSPSQEPDSFTASLGDPDVWVKYLTLGYGTAWGGTRPQTSRQSSRQNADSETDDIRSQADEPSMRHVDPEPDVDQREEKIRKQINHENAGYFPIGLKGDMDDEDQEAEEEAEGYRIPVRTLHVDVKDSDTFSVTATPDDERPSYDAELNKEEAPTKKNTRLRVVVYAHRPFIYAFLFRPRTESLSYTGFYRNLHTYFSPLHKPLSTSTSPQRIAARIAAASQPYTTVSSSQNSAANTQPIYDLVYDPRTLTTHSSLPNIPEPGTLTAEGLSEKGDLSWSRLEAFNVHSQILATVTSTRRETTEIERTCKTNRGWWVVWMRLPPSEAEPSTTSQHQQQQREGYDSSLLREAFLVRRARDAVVSKSGASSGKSLGSGMWRGMGLGGASTGEKMGGAAAGWGPKGLAEGIGIDARKYVEGLLSLNR